MKGNSETLWWTFHVVVWLWTWWNKAPVILRIKAGRPHVHFESHCSQRDSWPQTNCNWKVTWLWRCRLVLKDLELQMTTCLAGKVPQCTTRCNIIHLLWPSRHSKKKLVLVCPLMLCPHVHCPCTVHTATHQVRCKLNKAKYVLCGLGCYHYLTEQSVVGTHTLGNNYPSPADMHGNDFLDGGEASVSASSSTQHL